MDLDAKNFPYGNMDDIPPTTVYSAEDVGAAIRRQRKAFALRQTDIAGLGGTGNRFIVDLENGKPTVQLQMVLDVMALLGLEVVIQPKTMRTL